MDDFTEFTLWGIHDGLDHEDGDNRDEIFLGFLGYGQTEDDYNEICNNYTIKFPNKRGIEVVYYQWQITLMGLPFHLMVI